MKPSGRASATASSVSASSARRWSSDHGEATICLVEMVVALGPLLDRADHPLAVAAGERPVLHERDELVLLALAHDLVAVRVEHVRAQLRLDAHHRAVLGVVLAVGEADVEHLRVAEHLHAVVPALAVEVVEAAIPLDEQVRAHEPRERLPVARVPRHLGGPEQRDGVALELVGGEVGVVLGRLGGGGPHALVALRAACGGSARCGRPGRAGRSRRARTRSPRRSGRPRRCPEEPPPPLKPPPPPPAAPETGAAAARLGDDQGSAPIARPA